MNINDLPVGAIIKCFIYSVDNKPAKFEWCDGKETFLRFNGIEAKITKPNIPGFLIKISDKIIGEAS